MANTANGTPYVESSDLVANYPAVSLALANKVDSFAKIRQVVRISDTTNRVISSSSFVDVAGMSITITPQRSTSKIIIICSVLAEVETSGDFAGFLMSNASNATVNGAETRSLSKAIYDQYGLVLIGEDSPSTTSAVTYKMRAARLGGSGIITVLNSVVPGQIYAIEVAA